MKRAVTLMLAVALVSTVSMFVHEAIYDPSSADYTLGQRLQEIFIGVPMFFFAIFMVMFVPYYLIFWLASLVRKRQR